MIQSIYRAITENGFSSKEQDVVSNKRLGIKKSFNDELGNYIEIYEEVYGFSIYIYGLLFMEGYSPWKCDILYEKDVNHLRSKIEKTLIKH